MFVLAVLSVVLLEPIQQMEEEAQSFTESLTYLLDQIDQPDPEPPDPEAGIEQHWLALADCESGDWDRHGNPIPDSRRWDYGAPGAFVRENYPFDGGLNFHPPTWSWAAPMVGLGHIERAYEATPQEQVRVGEKVRELQGFGAWPVCSRKVGLR